MLGVKTCPTASLFATNATQVAGSARNQARLQTEPSNAATRYARLTVLRNTVDLRCVTMLYICLVVTVPVEKHFLEHVLNISQLRNYADEILVAN